ncbi:putative protein family upf0592 protein [Golovinomyces cichoracearum]|uniref:DUF1765-domain-containing protein n=1 Tax=Golovinomyces cichoracearum TaxID=62708 RepID=A0A420ITW0_9PEZI|nr:putative protein family upf0592 protein [Golovinomyces cichoracearum]
MHGISTILPSAHGSKVDLPRSVSSPTLPDLTKSEYHLESSPRLSDELPRSASYTSLPTFDCNFDFGEEFEPATFTQLFKPLEKQLSQTTEKHLQPIELERNDTHKDGKRGQKRQSIIPGPRFWAQKVKSQETEQKKTEKEIDSRPDSPTDGNSSLKIGIDIKSRAVSGPLTTKVRKSWISSLRKSPKAGKEEKDLDKSELVDEVSTKKTVNSTEVNTKIPSKSPDFVQKSSKSTFQKILERPSSILMNSATFNSTNSSFSSLHGSSHDNHSTPRTSTDKVPSLPIYISAEKLSHINIEGLGKRDELTSAFRALENDFSKFQLKSWSFKTNVVRSSLIPFLRNHSEDASIKSLGPEDLERRINVFHKWWTGLLEVLDGKHNQTVSGVDRPVLLQGCFDIMIRPEWRHKLSVPVTSGNLPLRTPSRRILLPKRYSPNIATIKSLPNLLESVNQRIRNLFIHNLSLQMNFVVEKMSLRYAPASLVAFCGKAAAYAFLFVPGVAEILVRIWKLQPSILRRVSHELGMSRNSSNQEPDEFVASFPGHLQGLMWSSVKSLCNFLRKSPDSPTMAKNTAWYGPWVARWCGRDSDLFFIFAKYYHILIEDFFAPDLTLSEKARAPGIADRIGYLLVLAQTLTAIDGTIHRQPAVEPLPVTFDDVLAGADASAAALPLPSNNSARFMAENRLIMILRDFLCEYTPTNERARITYGQLFGKMMQAAAKKTSLFDHNACFILCDFMEETLNIFARFHENNNFIDWYFWLDVCKRMLQSENTMTEIRLFAFLYGIWNTVTGDERRKEVVCLDWLLTENVFDKYFNHWCPMIRAYYMRLLCWRVCRNDGETTDLDTKIFNTVSKRIESQWAHYLYIKEEAESSNLLPPSTTPCLPAPGRRFLIIRNDNPSPVTPLLFGLEGPISQNAIQSISFINKNSPSRFSMKKSHDMENMTVKPYTKKETVEPQPPAVSIKKRWSLIGKAVSFTFFDSNTTSSAENSFDSPITRSMSTGLNNICLAEDFKDNVTTRSLDGSEFDEKEKTCEIPMAHRAFSFRFSLECGAYFENGTGGGSSSTNNLPNSSQVGATTGTSLSSHGLGERKLSSPRLPAPAQVLLVSKVPGVNREVTSKDWPKIQKLSDFSSEKSPQPLSHDFILKKSPSIPVTTPQGEESFLNQQFLPTNLTIPCIQENFTKHIAYKGRALAEWAIIVGECNGFLERRRNEGVPNLKMVEVPLLGVEGFRRFG